jgi:hypothetical protein
MWSYSLVSAVATPPTTVTPDASVTSFQQFAVSGFRQTSMKASAFEPAPTAVACEYAFAVTLSGSTIAFRNTLRPVNDPPVTSTCVLAPLPLPMKTFAFALPSAPRPPTSASARAFAISAVRASTVRFRTASRVPAVVVFVR